jgi:hypothetical protein
MNNLKQHVHHAFQVKNPYIADPAAFICDTFFKKRLRMTPSVSEN